MYCSFLGVVTRGDMDHHLAKCVPDFMSTAKNAIKRFDLWFLISGETEKDSKRNMVVCRYFGMMTLFRHHSMAALFQMTDIKPENLPGGAGFQY